MADEIVYPALTQEEYFQTWVGALDGNTQYTEMSRLIKQISPFFEGRRLKVLSIGAGNGAVEKLMLKNHGLKMSLYYGIEPSEPHRTILKKLIESFDDNVSIITDACLFTPGFKTEHRFDLVVMSNVLYYMENWQEALSAAHSLLDPDGKLVVFHQGDEEQLQIELLKYAVIYPEVQSRHVLVPSHIQSFLNENNVKYSLHYGPAKIVIDKFLSKDSSERSTYVVDFLLQTWYKNLRKDHQQKMYDFVVRNSFKDKNGNNWFRRTIAMFVVCK